MGRGVNAVKAALVAEFGAINIEVDEDITTREILLYFSAEGRQFLVRVSRDYDEAFASGQVKADLGHLGAMLRKSKDGTAVVKTDGIR